MNQDKRVRERMVFETWPAIKRAIKAKAGLDDVSPGAVINAALEGYLGAEIAQATKRLQDVGDVKKPIKEVSK